MYKLNIEQDFTDKYTNVDYKIGDLIEVNDERGEELLNDKRKLVSLNEKIEENIVESTDNTVEKNDEEIINNTIETADDLINESTDNTISENIVESVNNEQINNNKSKSKSKK